MLKQLILVGACVSAALMGGCSTHHISIKEDKPGQAGTVLSFDEGRPGKESFASRVFVNGDYVRARMAGQGDPDDFSIFDRHTQTLYNVRPNKMEADAIRARVNTGAVPDYKIEIETEESSLLDSGQSQYHVVKVNGEVCREAVTIKDLLPDVTAALAEMDVAATGQYSDADLAKMDACTLALNVYYPKKLRELGFVAREWDNKGYQRFISEFSQAINPPADFAKIPSISHLREFGAKYEPPKAAAKN